MNKQVITEVHRITALQSTKSDMIVGRITESTPDRITVEHLHSKAYPPIILRNNGDEWVDFEMGFRLIPITVEDLKEAYTSFLTDRKGHVDKEMRLLQDEITFLEERAPNTPNALHS